MNSSTQHEQESLLSVLGKFSAGPAVTEATLKKELGISINRIAQIINDLSAKSLIELYRQSGSDLVCYRLASTDSASGSISTANLSGDELLLFQIIRASENRGTWTRDMKIKSGLHQNVVTKVLRSLESKRLIKAVRSKNSTRKIYMLYDVKPSLDVSGGLWYTENELDVEFIASLGKAVLRFVQVRSKASDADALAPIGWNGYAALEEIHSFLASSGITSVPLEESDTRCVVETLILDGLVEKISSSDGRDRFRALKGAGSNDFPLGLIPCCSCSIRSECKAFGDFSASPTPNSCKWLRAWGQKLLDF